MRQTSRTVVAATENKTGGKIRNPGLTRKPSQLQHQPPFAGGYKPTRKNRSAHKFSSPGATTLPGTSGKPLRRNEPKQVRPWILLRETKERSDRNYKKKGKGPGPLRANLKAEPTEKIRTTRDTGVGQKKNTPSGGFLQEKLWEEMESDIGKDIK